MAHDLNLRSEWIDDETIRVSWNDTYLAEFEKSSGTVFALIAFGGLIACLVMGLASSNMWFLLFAIVWVVGSLIVFKRTQIRPNSIEVGKETTIHSGRVFQTAEISRIDYGLRSQLTGRMPYSDGKGVQHADPQIIRLWVADDYSHVISTNNWQNQVCHQIRNAIDKALLEVRKTAFEEKHVEAHGKKGNFGIPEY